VIIGITGPIASGKSSFCQYLSEALKACWIDLDTVAKELYWQDQIRFRVRREIAEAAYDLEEKPNFAVLRRIVFYDSQKLKQLEKIIYPELEKKLKEIIAEAGNEAICLVEGVKLQETDILNFCDYVMAVLADCRKQEERLRKKGFPTSLIMALFRNQPRTVDYYRIADFVIINNGSLDELREKAQHVVSRLIHDEPF
jgi:dephospho-CoA kinase